MPAAPDGLSIGPSMSITLELRRCADDIRSKASNDSERRAADLLDQLAGKDGDRLRRWLETKRTERDSAPDPMALWAEEIGEDGAIDYAKLDAYIEADAKSQIVRDEFGAPFQIDPVKEIASIAFWAATDAPITSWEKLSVKERSRRLDRIAVLATELANLLEMRDGPEWPPVIELFDIDKIPYQLRLQFGGHPLAEGLTPLRTQALGPVLRQLKERAEREGRRPARDARMGTSTPDARVLARHVSRWFVQRYGGCPNEVIADIVNLLMLNLDTPADGIAVRKWLATA